MFKFKLKTECNTEFCRLEREQKAQAAKTTTGHNHNNLEYRSGSANNISNADIRYYKIFVGGIIFLLALITQFFLMFSSYDAQWIDLLMFVLATFLFTIIGYIFLRESYHGIKERTINEDMLVTISIVSAYLASVIFLFLPSSISFFESAIEIMYIIYVGRFIEGHLTLRATNEMRALENLFEKKALLFIDDKEVKVSLEEVRIGDILFVKSGAVVPLDGEIIEGIGQINEASFTGESMPVTKKVGHQVYAGSILKDGFLKIKVIALKEDTYLGKIIKSVNLARQNEVKTQKISDRIAMFLVPSVTLIAILSFIFVAIFAANGLLLGFIIFISVLVVACPCSFTLTTPLSIIVALGKGTKNNVIFAKQDIFEKASQVDCVAFDKTGTLTTGELTILSNTIPKEYWGIISTAERQSSHPIAESIINFFGESNLKFEKIKVKQILGQGLEITKNKSKFYLGSKKLMENTLSLKASAFDKNEVIGLSIVYFCNSKEIIGQMVISDQLRPEAKQLVNNLISRNIAVYLITGDNKNMANLIASELSLPLEQVFYDVTPDEKALIVNDLKTKYRSVAFVGDGVNDTVALVSSNVGISIGSATDVAIESSAILIQDSNINKITDTIDLSRRTLFTIYRGFAIAILYNVIMIPIIVVLPLLLTLVFGIDIPIWLPILGAFAMLFNDTIAVFNALTIKSFKFKN